MAFRALSLLILRLFAKKPISFITKYANNAMPKMINAPSSVSPSVLSSQMSTPTTAIRYSNNFNIFFPIPLKTSFCPDGVLFVSIIKNTTRADNYVSFKIFLFLRPLLSDPQNQTGRKDSDGQTSQHIGRIMHAHIQAGKCDQRRQEHCRYTVFFR